jgi:hypothetical protein
MLMELASLSPRLKQLKPGDHLCCIYETEEEYRAVLVPFLRQGLEQGEKVIYIVDARTAEVVLSYLQDAGLDINPYLSMGQLGILTAGEAYIKDGVFSPDGMIALIQTETERALAEGYPALRITGEMTWALRHLPGSDRLIEYESKLNKFLPGSRCLAICQYDRRRFDPDILLRVLSTHPIAVIGTEAYDNFYYMPPEDFLGPDLSTVTLRQWIRNLIAHKGAEEEREGLIHNLQEALDNIKTLRGLIPICANCKKIRDDNGYWQQVEVYVRDHSEVTFTHGLCPECTKLLFPEVEKKSKGPDPI